MIEALNTFGYLLFLGLFFSLFRELSEHGKEGGFTEMPDWWNTPKAHRNKHEWGDKYLPSWIHPKIRHWIFFSPLVWITDAEHFFQILSSFCAFTAIYLVTNNFWATVLFYAGNFVVGIIKALTPLK